MAIELLDIKKNWAKIKSGFTGGPFFRSPNNAPNPTGYKNGIEKSVLEVQQRPEMGQSSPFTGKTFSQRKK